MFAPGRCISLAEERMVPAVTTDHPDEGWDRVAARLRQEMQQRGLSSARIARGARTAPVTIQKLLAGEPVARTDRLAALAEHLGWRGDAFDEIRAGREPTPLAGVGAEVGGPGREPISLATRDEVERLEREVEALRDRVAALESATNPAEDGEVQGETFEDELEASLDEALAVAAEEGGDAHLAPSPTDLRPRPRVGSTPAEDDPYGADWDA